MNILKNVATISFALFQRWFHNDCVKVLHYVGAFGGGGLLFFGGWGVNFRVISSVPCNFKEHQWILRACSMTFSLHGASCTLGDIALPVCFLRYPCQNSFQSTSLNAWRNVIFNFRKPVFLNLYFAVCLKYYNNFIQWQFLLCFATLCRAEFAICISRYHFNRNNWTVF